MKLKNHEIPIGNSAIYDKMVCEGGIWEEEKTYGLAV